MLPVNIDFWIFHFRGYEGHWAAGVLIMGYFYQKHRSLKAGYDLEWYNQAWGYAILSGVIGARLFHFLFWDTQNFLANPAIFFTGQGGYAILGGTIGTAFGGWAFCRYTKVNFLQWCDCLMIPLTLGLAVSRFSCFLNGDAYGLPTSSVFGVVFSPESDAWMAEWNYLHQLYVNSENPLGVISNIFGKYVNLADIPIPDSLVSVKEKGISNLAELSRYYPPVATGNYKSELMKLGLIPFPVIYPRVHPAQLYEAAVLFLVLLAMHKIEKYPWSKERMFFIFWIFYGANRFFIELFRADRNLAFGSLTYAQVISIFIVVSSIISFFIKSHSMSRSNE